MKNTENSVFDLRYAPDVQLIKEAIQRSQARALTSVNREALSLYYGIGHYISEKSRVGFWGTGALQQISSQLQKEMPGLKGFGVSQLKNMRQFYEEWEPYVNRQPSAGDLQSIEYEVTKSNVSKSPAMAGDLKINEKDLLVSIRQPLADELDWSEFVQLPFSHHMEIISKTNSYEERVFYIHECAIHHWNKYLLRDNLKNGLYQGNAVLPNNFSQVIPDSRLAVRTLKAFKESYLLDFINAEDLYENEEDRNEPMLNKLIAENIKDFILRFGQGFLFMGPQYRVQVGEEEKFIDLLFFNRQINALVAVELKDTRFKPSHLGQLAFYLSALDETVRMPHENPAVGLVLCREMDRTVVEVAIRDYTKPMGVATFRLGEDAPADLTEVLPDFNQMQLLMNEGKEEER